MLMLSMHFPIPRTDIFSFVLHQDAQAKLIYDTYITLCYYRCLRVNNDAFEYCDLLKNYSFMFTLKTKPTQKELWPLCRNSMEHADKQSQAIVPSLAFSLAP